MADRADDLGARYRHVITRDYLDGARAPFSISSQIGCNFFVVLPFLINLHSVGMFVAVYQGFLVPDSQHTVGHEKSSGRRQNNIRILGFKFIAD